MVNDWIAVIESKLEPVPFSGCLVWTGATNEGYGYVTIRGRPRRVHRIYYEHFNGPIGPFVLDHLCRVRCCANPSHLQPVTNRENIIRGESFSAVNARKTHCPKGHPYQSAIKLKKGRHAGETQRVCLVCKRENYRKRREACKDSPSIRSSATATAMQSISVEAHIIMGQTSRA